MTENELKDISYAIFCKIADSMSEGVKGRDYEESFDILLNVLSNLVPVVIKAYCKDDELRIRILDRFNANCKKMINENKE